jgi:hypothetical protein
LKTRAEFRDHAPDSIDLDAPSRRSPRLEASAAPGQTRILRGIKRDDHASQSDSLPSNRRRASFRLSRGFFFHCDGNRSIRRESRFLIFDLGNETKINMMVTPFMRAFVAIGFGQPEMLPFSTLTTFPMWTPSAQITCICCLTRHPFSNACTCEWLRQMRESAPRVDLRPDQLFQRAVAPIGVRALRRITLRLFVTPPAHPS